MIDSLEKKYKPEKNFFTIIFLCFWLLIIYAKGAILLSRGYLALALAAFMIFYAISNLAWSFLGSLILISDNHNFVVRREILGIGWTKKYEISKIVNVKISENTKSSTFWGFPGIRIHDKEKKLLTFNYFDKEIVVSKRVDDFEPKEFFDIIRNNK